MRPAGGAAWAVRSIVHVNDKAGRFGGTEEYICTLSSAVERRGIASSLVYGEDHGDLPPEIGRYRLVPGLAQRNGAPGTATAVRRAVLGLEADLVYVHNVFDGEILAALDTPGRSYRIVWYVHDHFPTCLTELRARADDDEVVCTRRLSSACTLEVREGRCVRRFAEATYTRRDVQRRWELLAAARHADAVVVISEYMRRLLCLHLPTLADRIHVLPRQIRPGRAVDGATVAGPTAAVAAAESGLHAGDASLGLAAADSVPPVGDVPAGTGERLDGWSKLAFCGRITREKGLLVLLDALERLPEDLSGRLAIAGVVENEQYWEACLARISELREQRPGWTIEYRGALDYEQVDRLYAETDIVAVPSVWGEPAGAVAAEALANGAAVIASDVGGLSTWVRRGETGLLVPPGDAAALADGIERLIREPGLRHRLAVAGRHLVSEHFTEEDHLAALMQLLETAPAAGTADTDTMPRGRASI